MSATALAQEYRTAAHAFLLHDHSAALSALDRALSTLSQISSSSPLPVWIVLLDEHENAEKADADESQIGIENLRRKLAILQITLLATLASLDFAPLLLSSQTSSSSSVSASLPKRFEKVYSLWKGSSNNNRNSSFLNSLVNISINDVYNINSINHLPPSIMVALLSAGIKIGAFQAARSATENWLADIPPPLYTALENAAVAADDEESVENNDIMSLSTVSIGDQQNQSQPSAAITTNTLQTSYHRLISLYSLHLLPRLNQYDQAREFIILSSRSNGGLLSQHHVDRILNRLESTKSTHADQLERKRLRALEQKQKQQQQQQQLQQQRSQQQTPPTISPQSRQHSRTKSFNSNKSMLNSNSTSHAHPLPSPSHSPSQPQSHSSSSSSPSSPSLVQHISNIIKKINNHHLINQNKSRFFSFILGLVFLVFTLRRRGRLFSISGGLNFSLLSLFQKLYETIKMVSGPPYI